MAYYSVALLLHTILSSSAAELTAVNRPVVGSNPTWGVREISSEVEHLLYTQIVTGSIPVSPIVEFQT